MKIDKLKNPYIRVIWEDIPTNFTKERLRRTKSYFQKTCRWIKCFGMGKCNWQKSKNRFKKR